MRFRLSRPARRDLQAVLALSADRWGDESEARYWRLLAAAMRAAATPPHGPLTRDCSMFSKGLRKLHVRHVVGRVPSPRVKHPVHVLYYRVVAPDLIETVRILHERMDPTRNFGK